MDNLKCILHQLYQESGFYLLSTEYQPMWRNLHLLQTVSHILSEIFSTCSINVNALSKQNPLVYMQFIK